MLAKSRQGEEVSRLLHPSRPGLSHPPSTAHGHRWPGHGVRVLAASSHTPQEEAGAQAEQRQPKVAPDRAASMQPA